MATGGNRLLRFVQERALLSLGSEAPVTRTPFRFLTGLLFSSQSFDVGLFEDALNHVIGRHSALHDALIANPRIPRDQWEVRAAAFARSGVFVRGMYVQSQERYSAVTLEVDDTNVNSDADIERVLACDLLTPFDFSKPPFIRARVIRISRSEHLVALVISHLVADGWAMNVIRRELLQAYAAYKGGSVPRFSESEQPHDFALEEHARILSGEFEGPFAYWSDLSSRYAIHRLKVEQMPAARAAEVRGAGIVDETLEPRLVAQINSRCRTLGITPYVFYRTCIAAALAGVAGKTTIAFGGNFANRSARWTATVGWLNNRHLLVADMGEGAIGSAMFARTKRDVIESLSYQQAPMAALWNSKGRGYEMDGGAALVTFDYHPDPTGTGPEWDRVTVPSLRRIAARSMNIDLDIRVSERPGAVTIAALYATSTYGREGVERLVEYARVACEVWAGDPDYNLFDCSSAIRVKRELMRPS